MTTVMFPNQVKQKILQDSEPAKEIVALDYIEPKYYSGIQAAVL